MENVVRTEEKIKKGQERVAKKQKRAQNSHWLGHGARGRGRSLTMGRLTSAHHSIAPRDGPLLERGSEVGSSSSFLFILFLSSLSPLPSFLFLLPPPPPSGPSPCTYSLTGEPGDLFFNKGEIISLTKYAGRPMKVVSPALTSTIYIHARAHTLIYYVMLYYVY